MHQAHGLKSRRLSMTDWETTLSLQKQFNLFLTISRWDGRKNVIASCYASSDYSNDLLLLGEHQ
jgi:hypothetical protein